MEKALAKMVAYTLGSAMALFFAQRVVPGVTYTGGWEILAIAGFAIALLNLAVAPILKILSLPLRILTFNLFSLVIDMAMVWSADVLLGGQFEIAGLIPLFWTTLFVAVLNFLLWTLILSPSFKS
ncbi:MAG: phage holin family protein [Candidatus Pacebacteria bacterium]|jgi:putative membrane protein|nr:phage holin family protein [Candidatus Paceibacterota bacterium]